MRVCTVCAALLAALSCPAAAPPPGPTGPVAAPPTSPAAPRSTPARVEAGSGGAADTGPAVDVTMVLLLVGGVLMVGGGIGLARRRASAVAHDRPTSDDISADPRHRPARKHPR
jgi:hypothetical protein